MGIHEKNMKNEQNNQNNQSDQSEMSDESDMDNMNNEQIIRGDKRESSDQSEMSDGSEMDNITDKSDESNESEIKKSDKEIDLSKNNLIVERTEWIPAIGHVESGHIQINCTESESSSSASDVDISNTTSPFNPQLSPKVDFAESRQMKNKATNKENNEGENRDPLLDENSIRLLRTQSSLVHSLKCPTMLHKDFSEVDKVDVKEYEKMRSIFLKTLDEKENMKKQIIKLRKKIKRKNNSEKKLKEQLNSKSRKD